MYYRVGRVRTGRAEEHNQSAANHPHASPDHASHTSPTGHSCQLASDRGGAPADRELQTVAGSAGYGD